MEPEEEVEEAGPSLEDLGIESGGETEEAAEEVQEEQPVEEAPAEAAEEVKKK